MTIQEAYIEFSTLVNRNATNNNLNVDFPRFVILFNSELDGWLKNTLELRNEDDIRYAQKLLVTETPLAFVSNTTYHSKFALPTDYFDFSNLYVEAKSDCCPNRPMAVFEAKSEDERELFADEDNRPSFDYAETYYFISGDSVCVFKDDFTISNVKLTYYRYPARVDIAGYINVNTGLPSANINPELDDKVIRTVLQRMAVIFTANDGDNGGYQLNKDRFLTT